MYSKITLYTIFIVFNVFSFQAPLKGNQQLDSTSAYDSTRFQVRVGLHHLDNHEYRKAIVHFRQAMKFFRYSNEQSPLLWCILHRFIGEAYYKFGASPPAIRHYELALEWMQNSPRKEEAVYYHILSSLGELHHYEWDYQRGKKYFSEALFLAETRDGLRQHLPYARMHLGIAYYYLERYEEAARTYRIAQKELLRMFPNDLAGLADLYDNIAANFRKQGLIDSSLIILQKELSLRKRLPEAPKYHLAKLYSDLGETYHMKGDPVRAEEYFVRAIEKAQTIQTPVNLHTHFYMKYIQFLKEKKRIVEGLICIEEARDMLMIDLDERSFPADVVAYILMLAEEADLNKILYETRKDNYLIERAVRLYSEAIERIRRHHLLASRQQIHSQQTEVFYPVYEGYLSLLSSMGESLPLDHESIVIRAFDLMEQTRNIQLLENIKVREANHLAHIPDSIIHRRKQLIDDLYETRREFISCKQGSPCRDALRSDLFEKEAAFRSYLRKMYRHHPAYHQMIYPQNEIDLARFRAQTLKKDDVFLEYFTGEDHLFTLGIHRDSTFLLRSIAMDTVRRLCRSFDSLLRIFPSLDALRVDRREYNRHLADIGYQLYRLLIPAFSREDIRRIIVVPDGCLHRIPFEALLQYRPDQGLNYCHWPFLIRSKRVTYQFSANLWIEMKENRESIEEKSLLFASDFKQEVVIGPDSIRLSALPNSIPEVQLLQEITRGMAFTGPHSTKDRFIKDIPGSNIVHLATHTVLDDRHPTQSFLTFSADTNMNKPACLRLSEILRLELPLRLITLNCCSTHCGPYANGRGLSSLSKGFAHAGAQSIIATRWPVSDQKADLLLTQTYRALMHGDSKDKALSTGISSLINTCDPHLSHPFYWSNYLLIGSAEAIYEEKVRKMEYILLALLVVLLFGYGGRRYFRA